MQNIQKISRLAATAAVGILTCALAAGCKKSDQARVNGTAQNTASSQSLDSAQRASQGGSVSGDSSYATASANPPTGGDSAGLQGNVSANTRTTRQPRQQASVSRETTSSQGGTVPSRTTRRTTTRRSTTPRGTAATASASASNNSPATVDENSSATMRSNRETGVTSRSAGSTGDTSSASIAAGYAGFLSEPQIYTVVFLANIGDSAASARAICVNPNAPAAASAAFDQQVRSFAQQMITDHAQLNQKAAQLQHAQNVIPTRSDVSDQVFTANQDAMGGTENAREYINREVTAHQNLLNTLDTKLIPNARDTSLRRMLTEARGVVQNHLAQAQRLQSGQQTASVSSANSELSVSASRDSLSANAHATSQPRPDTIRANSNSTLYQPATPSSSSSLSHAAPAPAPASTPTSAAANPCDINNRAANTAPGISPNNMMAPKTDTTRGYDSRVTTTPAPARPDTARTTMPRPDTIRTRSDSLRVRIDTGTTRQPQPAPGKP